MRKFYPGLQENERHFPTPLQKGKEFLKKNGAQLHHPIAQAKKEPPEEKITAVLFTPDG